MDRVQGDGVRLTGRLFGYELISSGGAGRRPAAARLPGRFGLTSRCIGRLKHLYLIPEAEQWGTLLYD